MRDGFARSVLALATGRSRCDTLASMFSGEDSFWNVLKYLLESLSSSEIKSGSPGGFLYRPPEGVLVFVVFQAIEGVIAFQCFMMLLLVAY